MTVDTFSGVYLLDGQTAARTPPPGLLLAGARATLIGGLRAPAASPPWPVRLDHFRWRRSSLMMSR